MKVVKVYGSLRKFLGQCRFEFSADTPAQALRALLVNFPDLQKWLIDSEQNGIAYRMTVGKQKVYEQDVSGMFLPWSEREVFSITPVVAGAGSGFWTTFLGVGLVGLAIAAPGVGFGVGGAFGFGAYAGAGFGAGLIAAAGTIGIGLTLFGVSQMISPTPGLNVADEPSVLESASFSGIQQTARQGVPVPIAYGRVFVGSAVISAGLDVVDVSPS